MDKLYDELGMLDRDLLKISQRIDRERKLKLQASTKEFNPETSQPEVPVMPAEMIVRTPKRVCTGEEMVSEGTADFDEIPSQENTKQILDTHFEDLQSYYFEESVDNPVEAFGAKILKLSKLTRIRQVSSLKLGDIGGTSNIISSIEFDREARLFATAGVSKKIRFYEFRDMMNPYLDLHCPIREISCKSKISCIAWNPYVHQQLASADYEGIVTVYDSSLGIPICYLEEHEKRSWSVDFSSTDPTRLASGSDDCYVKLWSTKMKKSICTIDGKANVCSVRFHPEEGHLLAFGSADHNVHLYDLRYASKALDVMKGHKKATSYVRFADNCSLVSASTDCTLRLWKLPGHGADRLPSATATLARTFAGHVNEKNFVGLSVQGDLLACGSENNSVYVYHRDLSKPLTSFRFSSTCPITESSLENEVQQFISSLSWKPHSNLLVAANSQGNIRILEIV